MPLAGGGVFHPSYIAGTESTCLAIRSRNRKDPRQDYDELSRGNRMVEAILQIMSAQVWIPAYEEHARDWTIASYIERTCRRRNVGLRELDGHVLEMRFCVRRAIDSRVSKMRRILRSERCVDRRGRAPREQNCADDYGGEHSWHIHALPTAFTLAGNDGHTARTARRWFIVFAEVDS